MKITSTLLLVLVTGLIYSFGQTYDINTDYKVSGKVGVGTSAPFNKFTVIGSETGTQITTKPIGKFINSGNDFSKLIIGSDNANYDAVFSMDNSTSLENTKLRIYIGNGTISTSGHNNDQIVLRGNGKVGIGTATPEAKLTVAGDIHSREVKVTIDAGSDFVFQNDYDLKTLAEVEQFILNNKHLPDIESAKEMEERGLELGKMDMKLLQKIEELTLYMIYFKKDMDMMKEENQKLKDKIAELEEAK